MLDLAHFVLVRMYVQVLGQVVRVICCHTPRHNHSMVHIPGFINLDLPYSLSMVIVGLSHLKQLWKQLLRNVRLTSILRTYLVYFHDTVPGEAVVNSLEYLHGESMPLRKTRCRVRWVMNDWNTIDFQRRQRL
jgi:hypothetical protein